MEYYKEFINSHKEFLGYSVLILSFGIMLLLAIIPTHKGKEKGPK